MRTAVFLAILALAACGRADPVRPDAGDPLAAALADAADPDAWVLLGHFDDGLGYSDEADEHTFYLDEILKLPVGSEYQTKDYALYRADTPPGFAENAPVIGVFLMGGLGARDVMLHLLPATAENLAEFRRRFPPRDRLRQR